MFLTCWCVCTCIVRTCVHVFFMSNVIYQYWLFDLVSTLDTVSTCVSVGLVFENGAARSRLPLSLCFLSSLVRPNNCVSTGRYNHLIFLQTRSSVRLRTKSPHRLTSLFAASSSRTTSRACDAPSDYLARCDYF